MEMVTLKRWVYPETFTGDFPYVPDDAVGRYTAAPSPSPYQTGVYTPENLVEGYSSLVWKEAFRGTGEFELKTHNISKTLALLPKGTLVSLRDTNEVCIVTTHHIGTDENNEDVLTVTGHSLLIYLLGNRLSWMYGVGPSGENYNLETVNLVFTVPDHMAFILWAGLVFPHSEGGYPQTQKAFELPFNIIVPHVAISQTISEKGSYYRAKWPPPLESRLDTVTALLDLDQDYGVRTVRPNNMSASIYRPSLTSLRGEGATTVETNITKMLFDIYQGVDRSLDNNDRVIFRHDSGDIDSAEYISSIAEHKNFVNSHAEFKPEDFPSRNPPTLSTVVWEGDVRVDTMGYPMVTNPEDRKKVVGMEYRLGEIASTANIKDEGITTANLGQLHADGTKYLKENREIDIITADISPYTKYAFKDHYNLGDIVLVKGKYGAIQKMVVSEYTRTEELSEEKGFPTLVRWEEPID